MAETRTTSTDQGQSGAFQSLLQAIDRKTAPALRLDLERLRERTRKEQRVRTLYISFDLGRHEMALPLSAMQEIGEMPTITPLPHLPRWIRGIVQIRGEILSVVDFQRLFHLREERRGSLKRFYILFRQDDFRFCLLVNRITGILNVDGQHDRLEPCGQEEESVYAELLEFVRGVLVQEGRRIFLLDSQTLGQAPQIRRWR